ncbi:Uncharacterised protein at_DN1037, partial [Pycnogonum litorale]
MQFRHFSKLFSRLIVLTMALYVALIIYNVQIDRTLHEFHYKYHDNKLQELRNFLEMVSPATKLILIEPSLLATYINRSDEKAIDLLRFYKTSKVITLMTIV